MLRRAFLKLAAAAVIAPALRWLPATRVAAERTIVWQFWVGDMVYAGSFKGTPIWAHTRLTADVLDGNVVVQVSPPQPPDTGETPYGG